MAVASADSFRLASWPSLKKQPVGIADMFDVIAGTSTGGLLAAGLAQPPSSAGEPPPDAKTLAELYINWARAIFPRRSNVVRRLFGDPGNVPALAELLGTFADGDLAEASTELIIPALDVRTRSPVIFTRGEARRNTAKTAVADVVMATSSAPTYFPPKQMKWDGRERTLVDGGLFANNPALLAYLEIRDQHPRRPIRILSIGCGREDVAAQHKRMNPLLRRKTGGVGDLTNPGWFFHGVEVFMDATSAFGDQQSHLLLDNNYHRIQPTIQKRPAMDDGRDSAIKQIENVARSVWKRSKDRVLEFLEAA